MNIPMTACIITLNEADRIGKCLESLSFCNEIIVVDSGSSDGTVELANKYGAKVLYRAFDGYRSQKQFSVDSAQNDWVICLDADEIISPKLSKSIEYMRQSGFNKATGFQFARCSNYHGRFLRHGNAYPDRVLRLFNRRSAGWHGDREIHEHVVNHGPSLRLDGDLLHYPYRSFKHELGKLQSYANKMAQHKFNIGKKPSVLKMITSPMWLFIRGFIIRLGFLDGWRGLVYHLNTAIYAFHKELFLRDLHDHSSQEKSSKD